MRTMNIIMCGFIGGWCVAAGAAHDSWRLIALGLIIACIALGMMLHQHPTVRMFASTLWGMLVFRWFFLRRRT